MVVQKNRRRRREDVFKRRKKNYGEAPLICRTSLKVKIKAQILLFSLSDGQILRGRSQKNGDAEEEESRAAELKGRRVIVNNKKRSGAKWQRTKTRAKGRRREEST